MSLSVLYSILELGFIYSFVSLAVYLSFRILKFPDLTVDGTFPLGAAVAASLLSQGVSPLTSTLVSFLAGCFAGAVTGFLHVRFRFMGLLASILTMSALYSINIRIMGKPNLSLLNLDTLFTGVPIFLILSAILFLVFVLLYYLLTSHYGLALRVVGLNPSLSAAYGVSTDKMVFLTLALSNGLVALAGALFAQSQGFADVSFGTGTIVIGLASLLLGEAIVGEGSIARALMAAIVGALVYRLVLGLALTVESDYLLPSDLNLVTSLLVVGVLILPLRRKFFSEGRG